MRKQWLTILCALCAAGMLAACGAEDDEIRMVEQEDIAAPSAVQEKEAAPTEAKPAEVSIETEKQEYKDGERIILVTNYDDVTVTIEGNAAATAAVMDEFAKRKENFNEELQHEDMLEEARENPAVDGNVYYYQEEWYTAERNDGRVLSFSMMTDDYWGGVHGYFWKGGVNFDGHTGKLLTIADITQDKAAFQETCVQEMLRQCEDLRAQGVLFEGIQPGLLQEIIEGKMEGEEWYFTESGIRFVSNIYEIAPYAAGSIDFDIPYEMINEELKEEYRG